MSNSIVCGESEDTQRFIIMSLPISIIDVVNSALDVDEESFVQPDKAKNYLCLSGDSLRSEIKYRSFLKMAIIIMKHLKRTPYSVLA